MVLIIDENVRAVAEFMQANMDASRLVNVAASIHALAPLLWGHYRGGSDPVLQLVAEPPAISAHDRRIQLAASVSGPAP